MKIEVLEILKSKNVKPTAFRELVLNIFVQNTQALSSVDIEEELPWSDRVTLFRTLKPLRKNSYLFI